VGLFRQMYKRLIVVDCISFYYWFLHELDNYMKRFLLLFGILLLTNVLFGQLWGGLLNYFYEKPAINTVTIQDVKALKPDFLDYLNKKTYSFFNKGKLYMLSYEDRQFSEKELMEMQQTRLERNLYLFRLDNSGWTIACDKPVLVGYVDRTSYVSYFPWRTAGDKPSDEQEFGGTAKNGSVIVASDGRVTIVLVCHKSDDLDKHGSKITFYNTTVVLKPSNDGTYRIQNLFNSI
jgi:hypothetical protein